ncbi:4-hydroxythreonine-4-phosphate dehydrogenase [hydrothermal vent metagenome]|uniref:4-hydroxythreonine-4-phosphate dehydrogenase n=1 Tax=hydrothermal vent metagenome TaxID=652676 RepID=A0A3B0WKG7_9ZZZZ
MVALNMPSPDTNKKIKIVITSGEPAGVGPDICLSLLSLNLSTLNNVELYIITDPELITQRARLLNININLQTHSNTDNLSAFYQKNKLNIIPLTLSDQCEISTLNKNNSAYVLQMLDLAHELCLQKKVDAMVTGPVQKSIINQAGFYFTGHTEYLADKTNATPVMMLTTKSLRVALATTHLPLKNVSKAITKESLTKTLMILDTFLKQRAVIKKPKILVCGLNPHAGEDGNLGDEEINIITPVIEKLKKQGLNLIGPLPADTLFTEKYLKHADAVLAMYHDQGLPVLKFSGFGKAVNITLGLPFIRTSVDHGTALDLAGTGNASNSSLIKAIESAIALSSTTQH